MGGGQDRGHGRLRLTALAASVSLAGGLVVAIATPGSASVSQRASVSRRAGHGSRASAVVAATGCHLGHGIQHVIEITLGNVHFFRDNPDVPSDLEMMPNLLHFIEGNGTLLSNNHTPLIAHTANDILTTATGLYPDRQGMAVANGYQTYNSGGTTDPASSFAYWTDPIYDTASTPTPGRDTNPSMVYSPAPPATTNPKPAPDTVTPAPWVPFTRAGCDVGDVAYVNQNLENAPYDIPALFGADSPEAEQLAADTDPYKDAEVADYVGLAVHCARGGTEGAFCSKAEAVKYGEKNPTHTAVPDLLPQEPGGYTGYRVPFGHRYIAPQLGAGTPGLTRNGYEITNSAGDLVDEFGNQINGAYLDNYPGFPGYDTINAAQSLAYVADMQESGVPVTYAYMAGLNANEYIPALAEQCAGTPAALGSGTACYVAQAQYYNKAFGIFFERLAADGITPQNSLFIFSSDQGGHEAGANVQRSIVPTPNSCDGAIVTGDTVKPDVLCSYPTGHFGELDGDITGLMHTQTTNRTPYSLEDDTAPEFYVTWQPGPDTPKVRSLELAVASLVADNPYAGGTQPITNYIADPQEEAILHMADADPARTPTFTLFAKPDYYLQTGPARCDGSCISTDDSYAWDDGDYAAEIDTNYVGFVGPGVKHLGLDGSPPSEGPNSAGLDSGQETVPAEDTRGPWVDETDIRPTLMYLTGLKDNYEYDGRVITEILADPSTTLGGPGVTTLGECYKQLNSSVGEFGTDTLEAATKAIENTGQGDKVYRETDNDLAGLEVVRDGLAGQIKGELDAAAVKNTPISLQQAQDQTFACQLAIEDAAQLDQNTP